MQKHSSIITVNLGTECTIECRSQTEKAGFEKEVHYIRALVNHIKKLTETHPIFDVRDLELRNR